MQPVSPRALSVSLEELRTGPCRIEQRLEPAWLDWALAGCEYPVGSVEGSVRVEFESVSGGVLMRGRVSFRGMTECGICLACAKVEVEPEVSGFLMPEAEAKKEHEDGELTPEDLEREWYQGDRIVLDGIIRDAIMLELPMTPRCAADCTVPAAFSGEGRWSSPRIDPRLAPLADLLKKHEGE